jgi:hypothetical protein
MGLKRWHANQILQDEQTKLELEIKKQSLRAATSDELTAVAAQDVEDARRAEVEPALLPNLSSLESPQHVEALILDRLERMPGSRFHIETQKIVAGVSIDILLRGKLKFDKDFLIEVKEIRKGFNFPWLREMFLRSIYAKNIYAQTTGRIPNTLLLIVTFVTDAERLKKHMQLVERVSSEEFARTGKDLVVIITWSELEALTPENFARRLRLT